MNSSYKWLALFTLAFSCPDLRAQGVLLPAPYPYPGGGYISGGGIGFSYQRSRLSIGGFLGGRYGFGPPPIGFGGPGYGGTRIIINNYPPDAPPTRPPQRPSLEEELAGVDLDAQPPKKKTTPEAVMPPRLSQPRPPEAEPGFKLPGVDVSKPKAPVRPEDLPQKKVEVPPPPQPEIKPAPKAVHIQLIEDGLAAFQAQEFGLAALRFEQATQVKDTFAQAHFLLAQARFALGKYPQAVTAIQAGLRLDKTWPKADFRPRQQLYQGQEAEFDAELKQLHELLAKQPMQPTLLFLSGYQLWFDGRRPEALARFRLAREVTADRSFIDLFLAAAPAVIVQK